MIYPTVDSKASAAKGFSRISSRALAAVFFFAAAPAAASPRIELSDGTLATRQLLVGADLHVALRGAAAHTGYELRLIDADGDVVATGFATADAAGNLEPLLLWPRTGVAGCDCGIPAPDKDEHTFADYEEAEAKLAGEDLEVQALSLAGVEVARVTLPILAASREIVYFSDVAGCPRTYFAPLEPLYLSVLHADRGTAGRQLFLAGSQRWPVGEPIADVRGASQILTLPPTGDLLVFTVSGWPLSAAVGRATSFDGVLRHGLTSHPWRLPGDGVLARPNKTPEGNGGIVITMDGCTPAVGGQP